MSRRSLESSSLTTSGKSGPPLSMSSSTAGTGGKLGNSRINYMNSSNNNMNNSIAAFYNSNGNYLSSSMVGKNSTAKVKSIFEIAEEGPRTPNRSRAGSSNDAKSPRGFDGSVKAINSVKTPTSAEKSKRLTMVSGNYSYYSIEDQRRLKHSLNLSEARENSLAKELSDARLHIKVLEDALEFRCDEIGLSGHADLLAKLSRNKGEIGELHNEIRILKDEIRNAHESKLESELNEEKLKAHIATLDDRIVLFEKERIRFEYKGNESVVADLLSVEGERDILLEYIQAEISKYNDLNSKYNELDSNYRILQQTYSTVADKAALAESSLVKETERTQNLQLQLNTATIKLKEVEQVTTIIKQERENISNSLEKKRVEVDELTQLQLSSLIDLREKDHQISQLTEDLKAITFKYKDLQSTLPNVQAENAVLKTKLKDAEEALKTAGLKLDSQSSKLQTLEPELARLRDEKVQWVYERGVCQTELEKLRPIDKSFNELVADLHNVSETVSVSNAVLSGIYEAEKRALEESSDNLLSQKHAIWIALPSLRQFCPILYDKIRSIAQDLHKKEMQYHDIRLTNQSNLREIEVIKKEAREEIAQLKQSGDIAKKILNDNASQMKEMESELVRLRSLRTTIDQIKLVLQSCPGGLSKIFKGIYVDDTDGSSKQEGALGNGSDDTDSHYSSFEGTGKSVGLLNRYDITDTIMPDVVGRVILSNSKAVVELQECSQELEHRRKEIEELKGRLGAAVAECESLRASLQDMIQKSKASDGAHESAISALTTDLEAALDLTEKQNALMITLEAKLEDSKRERQLKMATITSLQQKEESICDRIRQIMDENKSLISFSNCQSMVPVKDGKLIDYLLFISDLFPTLHNKVTLLQLKASTDSSDYSIDKSLNYFNNKAETESRWRASGSVAKDARDDIGLSVDALSTHNEYRPGSSNSNSNSQVRMQGRHQSNSKADKLQDRSTALPSPFTSSISTNMSSRFRKAQEELALMREVENE